MSGKWMWFVVAHCSTAEVNSRRLFVRSFIVPVVKGICVPDPQLMEIYTAVYGAHQNGVLDSWPDQGKWMGLWSGSLPLMRMWRHLHIWSMTSVGASSREWPWSAYTFVHLASWSSKLTNSFSLGFMYWSPDRCCSAWTKMCWNFVLAAKNPHLR